MNFGLDFFRMECSVCTKVWNVSYFGMPGMPYFLRCSWFYIGMDESTVHVFFFSVSLRSQQVVNLFDSRIQRQYQSWQINDMMGRRYDNDMEFSRC